MFKSSPTAFGNQSLSQQLKIVFPGIHIGKPAFRFGQHATALDEEGVQIQLLIDSQLSLKTGRQDISEKMVERIRISPINVY